MVQVNGGLEGAMQGSWLFLSWNWESRMSSGVQGLFIHLLSGFASGVHTGSYPSYYLTPSRHLNRLWGIKRHEFGGHQLGTHHICWLTPGALCPPHSATSSHLFLPMPPFPPSNSSPAALPTSPNAESWAARNCGVCGVMLTHPGTVPP